MSNVSENTDELGGVTEGIVGAKSKKKPMNPKLKKVLTWTILAAAVSAAIYGLVAESPGPAPQPASLSVEAGAENAASEADDDEPIEPSELTAKPVLSIFGKPVPEEGAPVVDESAELPADADMVKPIVSESPSPAPAVSASTTPVSEKSIAPASAEKVANQKEGLAGVLSEGQTSPEQEAIARAEAQTAAFNSPNSANVSARADKPDPDFSTNSLQNQHPAMATDQRVVSMQSHGALSGSNNLRVSKPEAAVGHVTKLKYANDQVYFVRVAKMLPTKILLLPDAKAKVISFVSNQQDWDVKQFVDGVLIVELKANAASTSVSDLLIQQGDRYYSFTLAASSVLAERNNMVIFTK